ncbi:MAG TPA: hypothetical protein VF591_27920 [Pyrinomonadaceae bacterium]
MREAAEDKFIAMVSAKVETDLRLSDFGEPDFFARSVGRLERIVERGTHGLKVWKDLGLYLRGPEGSLLRVDDERPAPLFERAGELGG